MQTTLKNIEIINALQAISELMEIKLPTKVGWNLNKNARKLTTAISDYDKFEKELIQEFAEKNNDGSIKVNDKSQWTIPKENVAEFSKRKSELLEQTDSLDLLCVKLSDLERYEIKGSTLFSLDFMIDDLDD